MSRFLSLNKVVDEADQESQFYILMHTIIKFGRGYDDDDDDDDY